MDIQQGNVVTSKMMMQLRPGMTKSQVRFIMGTPLIQDSFHSNRWDYFYQMRQEGKIVEQRRVILEFEDDALARVRGDVIPAGSGQQDLATPATTPESLSKAGSAKAKKDEKGLVDKLKFWKSDDEKKADEQPSVLVVPAGSETLTPAVPASSPAPIEAPAAVPAQDAIPAASEPAAVADPAPQEAAPAAEPVPDSVKVEPVTGPEPLAAPVPVPVEPQSVPESSAPSTTESAGDSMQLMLDRSIDLPTDAGNPSNVSNPSQAPDADLPSEASPDFFERMLEKIGF